MDRDLTKKEKSILRRLRSLERDWPDTLELFVWSDKVCIMDSEMFQAAHEADTGASKAVIETFKGIRADAGDPHG